MTTWQDLKQYLINELNKVDSQEKLDIFLIANACATIKSIREKK